MKKIEGNKSLVTGGAGFIGSHLVDTLIKKKAKKIVVIDNFFLGKIGNLDNKSYSKKITIYNQDASDYPKMKKIIEKERIDFIFNLASKPLGLSFSDPAEAYMTNIRITNTLMKLLFEKKYSCLVHCSSSEIYGNAQYLPMDEKHPFNPQTLYAAGKASADLMIISYLKIFPKLKVFIARPFNNYGPRQNYGKYAGIVPLTIKRILNGNPPVINGDGLQTRDFIFVRDTVTAMIKLFENKHSWGKVINIASGKEISIKEIVRTISSSLGYKGKILYAPARIADVKKHRADIRLAKKLIGNVVKTNLKEGIKETINWYKNIL